MDIVTVCKTSAVMIEINPIVTKSTMAFFFKVLSKIKIIVFYNFTLNKKLALFLYHDFMIRKILLLEDDTLFSSTLEDFLSEYGFEVDIASDGEEALELSFQNRYDLYLFDINVPKLDGISLLQSLREQDDTIPTIFLTSYKDDETLKRCFKSGCDDYLKKPVDVEELLLRIDAILKRVGGIRKRFKLEDEIYYDFEKRQVFDRDKPLSLSLKIILLLELFIEKNGKIVTPYEIIQKLWSSSEEYSEGSIRLYISKIREIVGKEKIKNLKKIGYEINL